MIIGGFCKERQLPKSQRNISKMVTERERSCMKNDILDNTFFTFFRGNRGDSRASLIIG